MADRSKFVDPELEARVERLIAWLEDHLDDAERAIAKAPMPVLTKLVATPLILYRRRIYAEIRQAFSTVTMAQVRDVLRQTAAQNRKLWTFIETALESPDWEAELVRATAALKEADPHDEDTTQRD
jgi:hypothetical protein